MPTTLTLKNLPDDIYARLKLSAQENHRSMNSEVIVCLKAALHPTKLSPTERLAKARLLRGNLAKAAFESDELDTLKRQGRP